MESYSRGALGICQFAFIRRHCLGETRFKAALGGGDKGIKMTSYVVIMMAFSQEGKYPVCGGV